MLKIFNETVHAPRKLLVLPKRLEIKSLCIEINIHIGRNDYQFERNEFQIRWIACFHTNAMLVPVCSLSQMCADGIK